MPRCVPLVLLLTACAGAPDPAPEVHPNRLPAPLPALTVESVEPRPATAPALLGMAVLEPPGTSSEAIDKPPKLPDEPLHPERLNDCDAPRRIVVHKAARRLDLRCGEQLVARFEAGLGFDPLGDKHHEGDGRTPEGEYYITSKYISGFHRSLQLSYPNVADANRGLAEGQITKRQHAAIVRANAMCKLPPQTTDLGSLLQIHGGGGQSDWTLGCVAINNDGIEQAFAFHRPGCRGGVPRTRVIIRP